MNIPPFIRLFDPFYKPRKSSSEEQCYRRPNGFNNIEWLSYIYYLKAGYSSIEKDRKAPDTFLQLFLYRMPESNASTLNQQLSKDIIKYMKKEYVRIHGLPY